MNSGIRLDRRNEGEVVLGEFGGGAAASRLVGGDFGLAGEESSSLLGDGSFGEGHDCGKCGGEACEVCGWGVYIHRALCSTHSQRGRLALTNSDAPKAREGQQSILT